MARHRRAVRRAVVGQQAGETDQCTGLGFQRHGDAVIEPGLASSFSIVMVSPSCRKRSRSGRAINNVGSALWVQNFLLNEVVGWILELHFRGVRLCYADFNWKIFNYECSTKNQKNLYRFSNCHTT